VNFKGASAVVLAEPQSGILNRTVICTIVSISNGGQKKSNNKT